MKALRQFNVAAILAAASLFALAPRTFADATLRMEADLPFQFQLGDKVMPAGHYSVEIDRWSHALVFRSATEYAQVSVAAGSAYRSQHDATNGRLAFDDHGTVRVLKRVWLNGESRGYVVPSGKAARGSAMGVTETAGQ
jgi:hypothetical protein